MSGYDPNRAPCPQCSGVTHQDCVDVGVGIIYGPRGCTVCGWSEDDRYDLTNPENLKADERGGYRDQYGGYHPKGSLGASIARALERDES